MLEDYTYAAMMKSAGLLANWTNRGYSSFASHLDDLKKGDALLDSSNEAIKARILKRQSAIPRLEGVVKDNNRKALEAKRKYNELGGTPVNEALSYRAAVKNIKGVDPFGPAAAKPYKQIATRMDLHYD